MIKRVETKKASLAVLSSALMVLCSSAGAAEDPARSRPFDPAVVAAEMWKAKLGLTGEQAERLAAAAKAKEDAIAPLRAELRAGLRKLRSQLAAKSSEKDIQAALDQIAQTNNALFEEELKHDGVLKKFLSPSQRAQILVGAPFSGFRKADATASAGSNDMTDALIEGEGEPE